jgi:hypothetical protein
MEASYIKKYKEENSDSFDSGNEEVPVPSIPKNDRPSKGEVGRRSKKQEEAEIAPYTFDPRQFLESLDKPTPPPIPKPTPTNKPLLPEFLEKPPSEKQSPARQNVNSLVSKNPKELSIGAEPLPNRSNVDVFQYKSARNVDRLPIIKNPPEESLGDSRTESEYRGYAREFDSEFGDHQREIAALSKQLVTRIKKLQVLERELNSPSVDISSLRGRLARDIESIEDELGEANHNIIVLMNERKNIKERFCTIRVKYNELNTYNKAYQEKMRT